MAEESDVSIPYGHDIDHPGVELSIDALGAGHARCEFVCPQCGQQLTKKNHGVILRHHFAHYKLATDRNCLWRYDEGIRQAYAQSQSQSIEAAQTVRLFVQQKPFSQDMAIFGAVPPLSSEDISKAKREKLDGTIHVEGIGTRNRLEIRDLLPTGGGGWIELDPTAPRYRIDVRPADLANGGVWTSRGVTVGDIFIGNKDWGRLVSAPRRVSDGQFLHYVVAPGGGPRVQPTERFRLGRYEVVRLPASRESAATLRQIVPGIEVDFEALRVDVVSPLGVPPSNITMDRVLVPRGREVILSVVPPSNKDRPIEVIPIPFKGEGQVTLPPKGLGVPRFLRLNLDGRASQRILLHWPFESDRDWVLDFIPVDPQPSKPLSEIDPVIGLKVSQGPLLSPLFHPGVELDARLDERQTVVLPKITLTAPTGFSVDLRGEFPGDDARPFWRVEKSAESDTLEVRLKDMFSRGCRTVEMSFGTLGRITLSATGIYDSFVARQAERQRAERELAEAKAKAERAKQQEADEARRAAERIEWLRSMREKALEALRERGASPRHISRTFALELLKLPQDTTVEDLKAIRNIVRRVRKDLRMQDADEGDVEAL